MTQESTVVKLSDLSRSIQALEKTVSELDKDIDDVAVEIVKLQNKMSALITNRDALIQTSAQVSDYRATLFPNYR